MGKELRFASVWDVIEDTPQQAACMRAQSALMMELENIVKERGMTQTEAATLFGITQPCVSDLMREKINLFSPGCLIDMSTVAGLELLVAIKKPKAPRRRTGRRTDGATTNKHRMGQCMRQFFNFSSA